MRSRFPKKPLRKPAAASSWEQVSDWYAGYLGRRDTYQHTVVFPGALKLLAPKAGGRYLDIACGEGSFSRMLAQQARCSVVGLDASPSLVRLAEKSSPKGCEYFVADATDFARRLPPASFDGATCILAIQNIENFEIVFRQAAAILKPSASLVAVMNHPCFRTPRQSGWGWDEDRHLQYRRVDRYLTPLEIPIQAHPGSAPGVKTISYHRPLRDYFAALADAGFAVERLEEWTSDRTSDTGPRAKAENAARREIPLFLAVRALKLR